MMESSDDKDWLQQAVDDDSSLEAGVVADFSNRMLTQARRELPRYLSSRVDPEDIVQSVFRSFFKRHREQPFEFESANDMWRLLSAMTYKKVCNKIRFHHRKLRDVNREGDADIAHLAAQREAEATGSAVVIMMELLQDIMKQLPTQHQEILLLRMNDCTIDEIAEQLQISTRTVDRSLKRVREICGEFLTLEAPE